MKKERGDTGEAVSKNSVRVKSLVFYNSLLNRLYIKSLGSYANDVEGFTIEEGVFTGGYYYNYHGDYYLGNKFKLSPDGQQIYSNSGVVVTSSISREEDLKLVSKFGREYLDATFDNNNRIYLSQVNINRIYVYDSSTMDGIDSFSTQGYAQYLNYRNGKIIAITKTNKFEGSTLYNYKIQTIDVQ